MDNSKMQMIADALNENEEFAKEVINMEPKDAAEALKNKGCDVTEGDLVDFVEACKKSMPENGELADDDLEAVSGGCKWCFGVGVAIGVAVVIAPW